MAKSAAPVSHVETQCGPPGVDAVRGRATAMPGMGDPQDLWASTQKLVGGYNPSEKY